MAKNWAHLPIEILGEIMNKLGITDIESCKYVCEPWRSAIQEAVDLRVLRPAPSPPWLLIPPPPLEGNNSSSSSYYNPLDERVYHNHNSWSHPHIEEALCVGSSHGWLAFIDHNCLIYLVNPLLPESLIRLPPIETLPCIKSSSLSPNGVIEFVYWNSYNGSTRVEEAKDLFSLFARKIIISGEDGMAMMIYGDESHLAVCKIGGTSWIKLDGKVFPYGDIYYSTAKKELYALQLDSFSFEVWDLIDLSHPKTTFTFINHAREPDVIPPSLSIEEKTLRSRCSQCLSLAELHGNLLLIVRHIADAVDKDGQIVDYIEKDQIVDNTEVGQIVDNMEEEDEDSWIPMGYDDILPHKTFRFDSYEFDWVKRQWVYVKRLGVEGDGVLFLGCYHSMAFSASDFPRLHANSVYFTDSCLSYFYDVVTCKRSYGGHDIGIFNFNNNEIDPCYYSWEHTKITPVPVWISPKSILV